MQQPFVLPVGTLSLMALALSPAFAAKAQQHHATELERIVVTAQQQQRPWLNTAAAVDSKILLHADAATDLAALLQGMPGLQADQRANLAQDSRFSIRGFGSRSSFGVRGIEVLLDDIPWSTPDGQSQPGSLLLSQLASVEVLRGPAAALYGNAAGGVMALTSKPLQASGVQIQHSGSAGMSQQSMQVSHAQQQLTLSQSRYQGYRPQNTAEKRQASWRSEFAPAFAPELQLKLRYDWSDDPLLQDPLALTADEWRQDPRQTAKAALSFDTRKSSAQRQWSLQLQPEHRQWQLSFWHGQRDIEQFLGFSGDAPTSAGGVVSLLRYYRGVKAQYQTELGPWQWQWFGQADQQQDQRRGYVNQLGKATDLRRDEHGVVSSAEAGFRSLYQSEMAGEFNFGWKWSQLDFRVRDYFINSQNPDDSGAKALRQPSYSAGWQYPIMPQLSGYISHGQGFESPTLTEMAYQRQGAGLNLALKPALNRQTDTGLKWQLSAASVAVDFFYADTTDELVIDQAIGGRTTYRNAAQTRRYGSELSWRYRHSAFWQQQLSLTFLHARFLAANQQDPNRLNTKLPGVAREQASWIWQYAPWGNEQWQLNASFHYRGQVFTDDQNRQSAPSSTVLNLNSRWQWQQQQWHWQLWLAADNITNQRYVGAVVVNQANGRSFEPGLPRQFQAGLQGLWLL